LDQTHHQIPCQNCTKFWSRTHLWDNRTRRSHPT